MRYGPRALQYQAPLGFLASRYRASTSRGIVLSFESPVASGHKQRVVTTGFNPLFLTQPRAMGAASGLFPWCLPVASFYFDYGATTRLATLWSLVWSDRVCLWPSACLATSFMIFIAALCVHRCDGVCACENCAGPPSAATGDACAACALR